MDSKLIAETNHLHALWHLGPPPQEPPYRHSQPPSHHPQPPVHHLQPPFHHLQPPFHHPQPVYYHPVPYWYHPEPPFYRPYPPSTSVYIVPVNNIPASSSDATAKLLQLPPLEITREVDVCGSVEAIVLCPGEEIVKGKVKANASEVTADSSCKGGSLLVTKSPSCEETVNKGDINGSRDVTVPFQGEVCKEKGEAEEIDNEGHMEGSMPVTEVFEKKGKAEAKAFFECEGGLADANKVLGDGELCLSDVQLLVAEDITIERHMEGSMHITEVFEEKGMAEEIFNDVNMEASAADMVTPEVGECKSKSEAKAVLENEDALAVANNLAGGNKLCLSDVQLLQDEEITREGDVGGSVEAIVLCPGEVCVKGKENGCEVTTDSSCKGGTMLVKKCPSCEDTVNKGDINGSRDVTVSFQGEVCKEKGEVEEIVNEGHMEGSKPVTEVSKKQGKAEDIAIERYMEASMHITEVSEEKGMAEDIAIERHVEGSMHITEVSEEKDMAENISNDVNLEASAADMVIPEVEVCKEQSKADAKAVLENEDALADANNLAGGNELCDEEITIEGAVRGSVEAIVLCPGEVFVKGKENGCEVNTDSSCKGGTLLVKKCPSCEETVNKGDINGSRDVAVPFQGEVLKEKGEAEEIDKEGHMEGSMPVMEVFENKGKAEQIVNEVNVEGSIPIGVIFEGDVHQEQGKAEEIFNEVNMEGLAADMVLPEVEVCKEQSNTEARTKYIGVGKSFGKWRARYYNASRKEQMHLGTYETEEAAAAAYDKAALRFKGPTTLLNFPEHHSNQLKLYSIGHKKTSNDGEKQGLIDASVSCLGEASKEKGKTEEDVGAGINDSTSNGGRWLLKKCLENSCGPTPSEPQFVMYDIHSGSHIRQMPRLNPADTQALEQSSPLEEYTEGKEVIKNLVWGNTFFVSKRAAKLLGHILAGGFQYTPSLPDKPASQPTLPAKRPHPRTRKPKARA